MAILQKELASREIYGLINFSEPNYQLIGGDFSGRKEKS